MGRGREAVQSVREETKIDMTDISQEEGYESEGEEVVEGDEEGSSYESPRDTVERILRESETEEEQPVEGDEAPKPEVRPEPQSNEAQVAQPVQKDRMAAAEHTYVPPARFNAKQKEAYNKLPPDMKQVVSMAIADIETRLHKGREEQIKAEGEAKHIVEAVRPYLLENPHLYQQGYTESRIVAELIGTHKKLTNPATAVQTWADIGKQLGLDAETLDAITGGQQQPQTQARYDISQDPQFRALQEELSRIKSKETEQTISSIVAEMQTVQNEMDASGRYVYPELHDDAFCEQLKPLVSALVGTVPGISYADALKRAYWTYKGQAPGNSYQQAPPRLQTNPSTNNRASLAAVSVRGKTSPSASPSAVGEIPTEAMGSARDTVRWAINQLRGN